MLEVRHGKRPAHDCRVSLVPVPEWLRGALAASLPLLLVYDIAWAAGEAAGYLDLARERAITDGLRHTGIGLVIVSHRPETVGAVDRIVQLGTG